ncbi:retrovirus-related pol polyprotein from transposon TNT 1-94 [Tanacetum coccineum]
MLTRSMAKELSAALAHEYLFVDFLSEEEPKKVSEALKHPAQGYNQQEVIDYDETFAPLGRHEAIRIILAFSTYMNFLVYQMDVKSAFLNGKLKKKFMSYNLQVLREMSFPTMYVNWIKSSTDLNKLKEHGFDLKGYLDSGYVGCNMDRKSTSGASMSLAKAEYVAAAGCCANILCMKSQLTDYDIIYEKLADIFTKPLDEPTSKRLIVELGYSREIVAKGTLKKSCLPPRVKVDYARLIWEDIIYKLSKKTREKVVPYPRFISLLLEYTMPEYENEELTINPTQVFNVLVDPKAPKPSSQTEEVPQGKNMKLKVDSEENNLQNTHLNPRLRHPNPKLANQKKKLSPV